MQLVSAILPTRGRRELALKAMRCFLLQDYPRKEIVIYDDADDPSFPDPPVFPGIRYRRLPERLSIAAKRNLCCEEAVGEIIVQFDSDDWSAPSRISDQVERMNKSGKQVTGYHSILFVDEAAERAWKYVNDANYAVGTTLCYRKSFWQSYPWSEHKFHAGRMLKTDDSQFVDAARYFDQLCSCDGGEMMVARIHLGNSLSKHPEGSNFRPMPLQTLPEAFRHS